MSQNTGLNVKNSKARVLALYLPQFHRIKENDEMWGKGFTEWTNVAKARPLFKGHYQPKLPGELGFYDLSYEDVRIAQAEMAREYGIEGFCYWHYWFGRGRRVLEMPFNEVVRTGKPNFPFCLAWANHSWSTATWNDAKTNYKNTEFLKQEYLGKEDYIQHFYAMLPAFEDERYITVDGKPLFAIWDPSSIPENELKIFIDTWQNLAQKHGLLGFHFVGRITAAEKLLDTQNIINWRNNYKNLYNKYIEIGFDAIWSNNMRRAELLTKSYLVTCFKRALYKGFHIELLDKYKYADIVANYFTEEDKNENVYPMIIPGFDATPRRGKKAEHIYYDITPSMFKSFVKKGVALVKDKSPEHRIIFLQAWNEWGEGNYIEPDIKYGRGLLEALLDGLKCL